MIRLPQWGRVVAAEDVVPWSVVDADGRPVEAIERFLRDFAVTTGGEWIMFEFTDHGLSRT
ncbi:MAG: hypothetical protein ACRDRD_21795 [Pseudonocardiaceae bacterium]